jgi:hypothetical protein
LRAFESLRRLGGEDALDLVDEFVVEVPHSPRASM